MAEAAEASHADIVIEESALEALVGLVEEDCGSSWEIPVRVVACHTPGTARPHADFHQAGEGGGPYLTDFIVKLISHASKLHVILWSNIDKIQLIQI